MTHEHGLLDAIWGEANQFVQLNRLVRRWLMYLSNLQSKSEEAIYNLSRP